ncbi:DUF924 family protein [Roseateles koreensis]|uniref:DUF924 family protein n=1 Tax=Roseateles koreensis TaxID=2987526 RepID=A0ABT5KXU3_9BURK|nr:DUF924 family protein [Roseateles koreensis]MDC8787205.1 DUF924 family protein [Roseateles koreensis]
MTALQLSHDPHPGGGRFHARVEGHPVELDYRRTAAQLTIHHTGVDPALQGRGLAARLVDAALQWLATQDGLQLVPQCSYVATYLKRQPKWQRLLLAQPLQQVLNFWFGPLGSAEDGQLRPLWFTKNEATDAEIGRRFAPLIEAALAGGLQDWPSTGTSSTSSTSDTNHRSHQSGLGGLARILLLDQFTRNHFRGQPRSFAGDPQALAEALVLIADTPRFEALSPLQRWFVLMPLEHAEDATLQAQCVAAFEALVPLDPRLQGALDFARKHQAVIAQFGRFPHRNAILGRISTAAEETYLALPGSGF